MGYNIKTKHCFLLVWESRTLISSPSDGTYNWVGYIAGIGEHIIYLGGEPGGGGGGPSSSLSVSPTC